MSRQRYYLLEPEELVELETAIKNGPVDRICRQISETLSIHVVAGPDADMCLCGSHRGLDYNDEYRCEVEPVIEFGPFSGH